MLCRWCFCLCASGEDLSQSKQPEECVCVCVSVCVCVCVSSAINFGTIFFYLISSKETRNCIPLSPPSFFVCFIFSPSLSADSSLLFFYLHPLFSLSFIEGILWHLEGVSCSTFLRCLRGMSSSSAPAWWCCCCWKSSLWWYYSLYRWFELGVDYIIHTVNHFWSLALGCFVFCPPVPMFFLSTSISMHRFSLHFLYHLSNYSNSLNVGLLVHV